MKPLYQYIAEKHAGIFVNALYPKDREESTKLLFNHPDVVKYGKPNDNALIYVLKNDTQYIVGENDIMGLFNKIRAHIDEDLEIRKFFAGIKEPGDGYEVVRGNPIKLKLLKSKGRFENRYEI
jgi:hypothetical protein